MRKVKWALCCLGAAIVAGLVYFLCLRPRHSTYPVPPILEDPFTWLDTDEDNAQSVHLRVSPTSRARVVLLSVINGSKQDYQFDIKPLCTLSGLTVFAADAEGKQHEAEIGHFHPIWPGRMVGRPGSFDAAVIDGLEVVTLQPGQSFSWPVSIGLPKDWHKGHDVVSERIVFPYSIEYWQAVLSPADGYELKSGRFRFQQIRRVETRRRQGPCPKKEFHRRLQAFKYFAPADEGIRVTSLLTFSAMRRENMLSEKQFKKVLNRALENGSPLVRAHAAAFAETWKTLLVDGNQYVRREALKAASGPRRQLQYPESKTLWPILLGKIQEGDAQTRILALKALNNHGAGLGWRQFQDTIAAAKADVDPNVSETALKLFDWVK